MKPDEPELDPPSPDADPASKKIPVWARSPIYMYLTMVAAFAVAGIFVLYYVMRLSR
jgi:hypothetical protein